MTKTAFFRMKVCIINNLYPPYARGGAERVVQKTVESLSQAGHSVVVVTTTPKEEEITEEKNVKFYRFRPWNFFFYTEAHHHNFFKRLLWHGVDIFHFSSAKKIAKILKEEKPDVVHTHNCMGIGFLTARVVRKLGIPHIHTIHDVQLVEPSGIILKQKENSWRYRGVFTRLYVFLMRHLFGSPDIVISPSQFLLQFYERWKFFPASHRIVLRNPVTLETNIEKRKNNTDFRFLYLGQIETHKGVLLLAELVKKMLAEKKVHFQIDFAGGGSQLDTLKHITQDCMDIHVHGRVEYADLVSLFAEADITVVPSLCYENSPTVIFESFSYETPVLASNIEGIAELIREGENGITFPAGDEQKLQEKMEWCIENREKIRLMGMQGRKGIESLSQSAYMESLLRHYQKACQQREL